MFCKWRKGWWGGAKAVTQHLPQACWCPPAPWDLPVQTCVLLIMVLHEREYPSDQLPSSVLAVSAPSILSTKRPHHWRGQSGKWRVLRLCRYWSTRARTLVCYQYCFSHKIKTQLGAAMTEVVKSILVRPMCWHSQLYHSPVLQLFMSHFL